jgi:hypothetical protein
MMLGTITLFFPDQQHSFVFRRVVDLATPLYSSAFTSSINELASSIASRGAILCASMKRQEGTPKTNVEVIKQANSARTIGRVTRVSSPLGE